MDKQQEIEKMACDMCLVRHICTKPNEPIECCKPLKMAKKAVEAGYGDVRAAVKEFAGRLKERFEKTSTMATALHGRKESEITSIIDTVAAEYGVEVLR